MIGLCQRLHDCPHAINGGTRSIALYELADATRRLQKIAAMLEGPSP